jgi:hypothetical protein
VFESVLLANQFLPPLGVNPDIANIEWHHLAARPRSAQFMRHLPNKSSVFARLSQIGSFEAKKPFPSGIAFSPLPDWAATIFTQYSCRQ